MLEEKLLDTKGEIENIYKWLNNHFNQEYGLEEIEEITPPELHVKMLVEDFSLVKSKNIRTVGIDFPIQMSTGSGKKVLMICAMDPLRNEMEEQNTNSDIGFWVPFSIVNNPLNQTKYSEKQNLLFFHTLLNSFDIYVTDIYKVFYREGKRVSNTQPEYKSLPIHKEILETEIKIIQPYAILTLGNNARDALSTILDLKTLIWDNQINKIKSKEGINIIMVPHISGAANGAKSPILNNPMYRDVKGKNNEKYANIIIKVINN
jgi:hypothetical protein